jgi:hypothetical protein
MATTQPRRHITCRLCGTIGHNIRSCSLHEITKKQAILYYKTFIFYAIVGCSFSWDNDELRNYPVSNMTLEQDYINIFNIYRNEENALEKILDHKISWLSNIEDVPLKSLIYEYNINNSASKENVIELLHYIFISEADNEWMFNYDIQNCVPYIVNSYSHIQTLENANAKIFTYPIINNHRNIIQNLYNLSYREERIRILYEQNRRILRFQNSDLHRQDTRIQEIDRQISRLQRERHSQQVRLESISDRRDTLAREIELFPDGIYPKKIKIVHSTDISSDGHSVECPICYDDLEDTTDIVKIDCGHMYCSHCLVNTVLKKYDYRQHRIDCACPLCRNNISNIYGDKQTILKDIEKYLRVNRLHQDVLDIIG